VCVCGVNLCVSCVCVCGLVQVCKCAFECVCDCRCCCVCAHVLQDVLRASLVVVRAWRIGVR